MTGVIETGISEIVNRLDNIKWQSIIFEAIANAIQANAKNITIKFITDKDNSLKLDVASKVTSIAIEDNGDGFTPDNIASFRKYLSPHKKHLGCKGIGRFFYLKKFENVYITSLNNEINFVMDANIDIQESESSYVNTTVYLNQPREDIIVDSISLEKNIREHFIADFKLRINDVIQIVVCEDGKQLFKVESTENPVFKDKIFNIGVHEFNLSYTLNPHMDKYDGYYCAGGRVVIMNSQLDAKKKWRKLTGFNISFLLTSDYFTHKVNDVRGDFNIKPRQANHSILNELSWEDINEGLTNQIKVIAKEHDINLEHIAQQNLNQARQKYPYLSYYLKSNEDVFDVDKLIANAQARLEEDKEKLRSNKNQLNEGNFQRLLNIVTQSELAEYIFDRQRVIDKLKKLTDTKSLEKEIHNLFMKRYTKDEQMNYRSNHLWLFDDRFMTYDKVFSEATLEKVFPELINNLERPDIISFSDTLDSSHTGKMCLISNTYEIDKITDIVLIEFKRPDEKITPVEAMRELRSYADYINHTRHDNKIRIWAYAFLKFNDDTARDLDLDEYNKIPTHTKYPIYYKYNHKTNMIINFMDYESLAYDAESRNNTFMKILNGDTL